MTSAKILEFYARQSAQTSPGHRTALFTSLPDDVMALCEIVQGLFIYDVVAKDFFGFDPPKARLEEIHTRSVGEMLERIRELDDAPLTAARPPEKRMLTRCDGFVMTLASILRSKGVPAGPLRVRRLLQSAQIRRSLGVRVVGRRAKALAPR